MPASTAEYLTTEATQAPPHATIENRNARFEQLVSVHIPALTRVAVRNCPNRETAEDIVQETLLRAWRHLDQLREPKAAKGWLFMILRNERVRAFSKTPPNGVDIDVETLPGSISEPPVDAITIRHRVTAMAEKYRTPLALFAYEGYGIEEISISLGIKPATVKTRLFRAREKLRAAINYKIAA